MESALLSSELIKDDVVERIMRMIKAAETWKWASLL